MNAIKLIFTEWRLALLLVTPNLSIAQNVEIGIFNTGDNTTYEVRARPIIDFVGINLPTAYATIEVPVGTSITLVTDLPSGISGWAIQPVWTQSTATITTYIIEMLTGSSTTNSNWIAGAEVPLFKIALNAPSPDFVRLAPTTSQTFLDYIASQGGSLDDGFYSTDLLNGLGESQVDGYYSANAPLPVTLAHFDATAERQLANLSWATTSESNSSHFEIQHSIDAKRWTEIGRVKSVGTGSSLQPYHHVHQSPSDGINYYRLRTVDLDGTSALSEIKSLRFDSSSLTEIFPNPAAETLHIRSRNRESITSVALYNSIGLQAYRSAVLPEKGIAIGHLPPGIYMLRITRADQSDEIRKVVIGQ